MRPTFRPTWPVARLASHLIPLQNSRVRRFPGAPTTLFCRATKLIVSMRLFLWRHRPPPVRHRGAYAGPFSDAGAWEWRPRPQSADRIPDLTPKALLELGDPTSIHCRRPQPLLRLHEAVRAPKTTCTGDPRCNFQRRSIAPAQRSWSQEHGSCRQPGAPTRQRTIRPAPPQTRPRWGP
jgi:hypothetical protein